jgi:hypothetical protein
MRGRRRDLRRHHHHEQLTVMVASSFMLLRTAPVEKPTDTMKVAKMQAKVFVVAPSPCL